MDSRFENIHKILGNLPPHVLSALVNVKGEEIQGTSIFNSEDGSFNEELLTKEGFLNNLFGKNNNDKKSEKLKCFFGDLYDAIANLDGDGKMSQDEIKFLASLADDTSKETIDKSDFMALGVINRDINKNVKPNNYKDTLTEETEKHIDSPRHIPQPETVSAVNENLEINGKIDAPVIQGGVGDCWLLSGINALNSTEKGKQIIRNAIIPNDDGTVTINFAGVGKKITLTPEEIKEHDTDLNFLDNYSNGDNDALVLEMAMQKLIEENPSLFPGLAVGINGGNTYDFWKAIVPNHHITKFQEKSTDMGIIKDGISVSESNGGASDVFSNNIRQVLTQALNNKNIAMEFVENGHSMAITDVQENQVTYLDSMDYTPRTMSWDSFINRGLKSFSCIDLSKES